MKEEDNAYQKFDERGDGIMKGEFRLLDVYEYRQRYGYFSILFSIVQTAILIVMMCQCGVAPLSINPMVGPYPDALSYWGAKNAALIIDDGEHWRLLSPILLHAGVIHLIGNVSCQIDLGIFFEKEWGSVRWLIIYLGSAIGSSVLSTIIMPGSISVGSSGAVMGLFGAKLTEILCRICEPRITVQQKVGNAIRKELFTGMLIAIVVTMVFSFLPYVDWAAHLGGLLAGIFIGMLLFACSIEYTFCKILWFIIGLFLTVFGFALALDYMYHRVEPVEELADVCGYYQQFFEDYECHCTKEGGD
mmetsp:Transcript_12955/g.19058  ORF Transcript_12955/g.19058 Transcript_12955/m.19058 type:complete len:303 (+) Transcript_12955:78-986(+)